ncbi:Protein LIN-9/Protein ALWAYS EARLY [Trema orientale]|uniref:Protein LIN-9/Protein ALWAYS EARLY n=1 Tax=Trema orientale TaxID=63057 RepID=A0A2P5AMS0_TREOI|nr:Protein LIN-9/Protein ALWAYS EARLY [Trema orientale]
MAPNKKSRVNKRYGGSVSYSPDKDVGHSAKNKQRRSISISPDKEGGNSSKNIQRKKKLSDKLGSQWSKGELERFYEAYRKYGKDWGKVAAAVRNRSVDMVEALYSMNRAYLSLPEGTASVVGLIAMMTDHYNVLEGSDSEQESNDGSGVSRKPQKRKRGRDPPGTSKDIFQSYSIASADGCLSLLKRKRSDGSQPRVVGKRTPRIPVSYSHKRDYSENYISPIKKGRKSENDNDDEVAHVAALALTEASQRVGSPQVSTPYKHINSSPAQSWERLAARPQNEVAHARLRDTSVDEDLFEGSVGSRGAENGDYGKDTSSLMDMEGVGTVEVHRKGKKFYGKKEKVEDDDGGEACSGTEEGLNVSSLKGKVDVEVSNAKAERVSPQGQRKRSKKLFFGDESSAFDALQTLADLSLMMPPCTMESESSVQLKEERTTLDTEDKSSVPEATSQVRNRNKFLGAKQKVPHSVSRVEGISKKSKLGRDSTVDISNDSTMEQPYSATKTWKRKRKLLVSKVSSAEAHLDSHASEAVKTEVICEEENKPVIKGKRSSQTSTPSKQWKSVRSSEGSLSSDYKRTGSGTDLIVSTAQVPAASQVNLPTKQRSKRKMYLPRALPPKEVKSSQNIVKRQANRYSTSAKEKLSCCLSSYMVRRWCTFEWFYSAIDYPWFAKREFEEYLNHVGLGHIPRLTRVEWGVIRSSLGKPRRFSEHFLHEEREKLKQYRESVREHYTDLRTGVREGLPTDLAKPLTVGQRVIAIHPRTREVHDGSVLTVDHDKCRVQFDRPEIGVEFVMDVDCMPLNPMENMPEALRRQNITIDKFSLTSKEPQLNGNLNFGGPVMFASTGHLEKAPTSMNTLGKHGKGDSTYAISQLKAAAIDIVSAQPISYGQSFMMANNQAREADVRALSELTRALDKKEALLMELRKTNNEIVENQNNGDYSSKDCELFKKHYATVLVSSALLDLRQRNTYPGNALFPGRKTPVNSTTHGGLPGSFDNFSISQDSGSSVVEIVKGSTIKAQTMVDAAIQAFSSIKEGEDAYAKIKEALDSMDYKSLTSESRVSVNRSQEQVNGNVGLRNQLVSCTSETAITGDSSASNLRMDSDKNEAQVPSDIITSCVATLLMIQTCTERQYPPAEVAQILDSAVSSLHPCCPQNLQIYREIQNYMGRIKTQILALVPT